MVFGYLSTRAGSNPASLTHPRAHLADTPMFIESTKDDGARDSRQVVMRK